MSAGLLIRGFEVEAAVGFLLVGVLVVRTARTDGLGVFGCLFVGNLAVALLGDPIANWALTALYSDTFVLLPRAFGLGLSPAQSLAVPLAYPWCFPMLAYGGQALARRLGGRTARAGFLGGALVGGGVFALFVYALFVPSEVIVYQRTPPAFALGAGTPGQLHLLDAVGVAVYVGAVSAALMPAPGASYLERWLPSATPARIAAASAAMLAFFLLGFAPAIVARLLGLDTASGFATSPFAGVPLYP